MSFFAAAICFIACHGGPADHFAAFAEELIQEGYEVEVFASGPALKKFQDRDISVEWAFNADHLSEQEERELASQIVKKCSQASVVLTDVGHVFDITLQQTLAKEAPEVLHLAYYDNPEPYVPGGYSNVAAKVMLASKKVLLANANLEVDSLYQDSNKKIELPFEDRVGLGYYPVSQAEKMMQKRIQDRDSVRAQLFSKYGVEDKGQKVLVYFGGNNDEYFNEAFPAFLSFLSDGIKQADLSHYVIVFQQHPGAKSKNIDRLQMQEWIKTQGEKKTAPKMILSDDPSDAMQILADAALYYQTSMGPFFALAGIPTIQVGHRTYEDVLIRGGLCVSVTNPADFVCSIATIKPIVISEETRNAIFKSLGIKQDWFDRLKHAFKIEN